jgi:hypothetical protein
MTMYCEMCRVRCETEQPWLDHLAGRKHRSNVFRMKTDRRLDELKDWRNPLIVDDEFKLEESIPQVKQEVPLCKALKEAAEVLTSLKGHVTQAQCRLNLVGAAAILLVIFVLSSTWWMLGVRAENGDSFVAVASNSWAFVILCLIAGWYVAKACLWVKESVERIVENLNQRVTSIERSVNNVGVNIEQQVQNAGIQIQLSVEQKVAEIEQKVSSFVAPVASSVQTGVSVATMAAMVGAVYYLCRSLFVRHAEKKESLEKLTSSKVFKLFDCLALTVIVPMMLYNGLSFAFDMWKQVKFIAQMASTACTGVSILGSLFGGNEVAPAVSMNHVEFVQASVSKLTETIDKKLEERKQGREEEAKADSESPSLSIATISLDTPAAQVKPFMAELQRQAALLPKPLASMSTASAPRVPGDTRGLGYVAAAAKPDPDVPSKAFDALREMWGQTEDLVHLNALKKQCTDKPWLLPVVMIVLFSVLLLVVKVLHKEERKGKKKEKSKDKTKKVESKTQQPKKNASKASKVKTPHKHEKSEAHDGCCHITSGKHLCPWFKAGHKIGVSAKKSCNIHCGGLKCMHWAECDPKEYPALTPMPEANEATECVHQDNQLKCKKCGWTYEGTKSVQKRHAQRAKNKAGRPAKAHASYQKPGDDDNNAIWSRDNGGNLVRTKRDDNFVVPSHLPHAGLLNDFMHGTNESAQRGAAKKLVAAVSKVKKDLDKKHPKGKCSVCSEIGHVSKSCPNKGKHPCYFFKKGNCKFGNECSFAHDKPSTQKEESAINGKRFKLGNVQSAVGLARIDTRCLNANLIWNGIVVCEHIFKKEDDVIKFQFRNAQGLVEHSVERKAGKKLSHDLMWFTLPESLKGFPQLKHRLPTSGMKVSLYAYDSDEDFAKMDISHDAAKILRMEDVCDSMSLTSVSKHKVGVYKLSSVDGNCSGVVVDSESGKVVGFHNATRGGVENLFLAITPQIVSVVTGTPQKN